MDISTDGKTITFKSFGANVRLKGLTLYAAVCTLPIFPLHLVILAIFKKY